MADTTFEAVSDIRELNPHELIKSFGGFEVFTPINSNDTNLAPEVIVEKQHQIANAVEMITEWAAVNDFSDKKGFEHCVDLNEASIVMKQSILEFVGSGQSDLILFEGDEALNVHIQLDVKGRVLGKQATALTERQKNILAQVLEETFNSDGILSLGRDSKIIDSLIEEAKNDEDINIALKNAGTIVQKYVNTISKLQDKAKLESLGKHIQEGVLSTKEDGSPRGAIAKFLFGDITGGKDTLTGKLDIKKYTFITGTGGVSAPGPEYFHLDYISKGFRLFVRAQGFNSIMDNIALPAIAGFRLSIEDQDAPIVFDGYPRSTDQADRILKHLDRSRFDIVYMEVRDVQVATWRSVNRMLREVNDIGDITRNDDIDSLAFGTDEQQNVKLRQGLKETLKFLVSSRKTDPNIPLDSDSIDDITSTVLRMVPNLTMDENSRYNNYRNTFRDVIGILTGRDYVVTRIPTDLISRDNVAQAFLDSVNIDYLPETTLSLGKQLAQKQDYYREHVITSATLNNNNLNEVTTAGKNIKKLYDTTNARVGNTFHNYVEGMMKKTKGQFDFENHTYSGLFTFRMNNRTHFGAIVGVEFVNGRYQPIISVSGMNSPLRLSQLPKEFHIVNTTAEAAQYQQNLRQAYHGYRKMLAQVVENNHSIEN